MTFEPRATEEEDSLRRVEHLRGAVRRTFLLLEELRGWFAGSVVDAAGAEP